MVATSWPPAGPWAKLPGEVLVAILGLLFRAEFRHQFVASHGYDATAYSVEPLPQMRALPEVAAVALAQALAAGSPTCASTRQIIANDLVCSTSHLTICRGW